MARTFMLASYWRSAHWKKWDAITPDERAAYEQVYENNQTQKGLSRLRGEITKHGSGHDRRLLKQGGPP